MMRQARMPLSSRRDGIDLLSGKDFFRVLPKGPVNGGFLNIFISGSGAGLSVNENCDATVRSDLTEALRRWMPASGAAGADARGLLMSPSLTLPVSSGGVSFGTWQGIYLSKFRPDAEGEVIVTYADGASTQANFTFNANKRSGHAIDAEVEKTLGDSKRARQDGSGEVGTLLVHEKHTSASISLAGTDLEPAMREVAPERWNDEFFQHTYEGPDDMPGHCKSTLLGAGVALPLVDHRPALGESQGITLNEHRDCGGWGCGHSRKVQVTELSGGARRVVEAPSAAGPMAEVTAAVRSAIDEELAAVGGGPGLVHLFAPSPTQGVVIGSEESVATFADSLARLTDNAAARAAMAKNGPMVPINEAGELLLADGQGIYLYDAASGGSRRSGKSAAAGASASRTIVVTVHGGQLPSGR